MSPEIVSRKISGKTNGPRNRAARSKVPEGPAVASLRLHAICLVMALLAAFIFTLTEHDDHQQSLWCAFEIAIQTLMVVMATWYLRRRISVLYESPVIMPMLLVIASLSLICEPIQRLLLGSGHPFEILIMHCSCNLMLALAVCGFRMSFQRLAALIAVFLTIFCCTISSAPGLIPLVAVFSVAGIAWLVAAWWETVDRRMLDAERAGTPLRRLAFGVALPLLILIASDGFGSNTVTTALRGFIPSSGGNGDYSPYSRGGINDGDALVAGDENIKSFAPLDDAPFLDSEKPSLYDVFNETYDEPLPKSKRYERAIPIPADLLKHIHQLMAEAKQAGREFSLQRSQKKSDSRRIHDLQTHAIFYLAGRTPLHLRMEVYELFDGVNWLPLPRKRSARVVSIEQTNGRDWLKIPQAGKSLDIFSGTTAHSIKVANLDGNTLPIPAHPVGVSIDRVNRTDMYRYYESGLVSLDRKAIPAMVPVSVVSHCVDWEKLNANQNMPIVPRTQVKSINDVNVMLPEGDDIERIRKLAQAWTAGHARGWPQIEAVRKQLQKRCVLDRHAHATTETDSPVAEFLFETRRGPEYQFASAAAVMIRSLGYPARVVSGFYARPEKYDSHKQHTIVDAADAHFWCEVYVGRKTWLTVEASPGYEVLTPPPGLLARLKAMFIHLAQLVLQHRFPLLVALFFAAWICACRNTLQDALLTLRWRFAGWWAPDRRAVLLAILIEYRLRLSGLERRRGTTLKRWAHSLPLKPLQSELTRVAEIADEAAFGQAKNSSPVDAAELERLASELSFRRLRSLRQKHVRQTL